MKKAIWVDIDGTLADCSHRVHHVQSGKKNWPAFFEGIPNDKPIEQIIWLSNLLFEELPVILCSGRSEDERIVTEAWLAKYGVSYTKLYMRQSKDYRPDHIVKLELLEHIRKDGYDIFFAIDDRQQVVDATREAGLFVLQCDPKPNFTAHHDYIFDPSILKLPFVAPLTILIGPSGAGKSSWIQTQSAMPEWKQSIISSDVIRSQLTGNFRDQTKNEEVFETMHELAKLRLKRGLPVILDATHLKNANRIKAAKLVPTDVPVRYVVINRPLKDKIKTGSWRNTVSTKGKTLIEHHDQVFNSNLKSILSGDGLSNVIVENFIS